MSEQQPQHASLSILHPALRLAGFQPESGVIYTVSLPRSGIERVQRMAQALMVALNRVDSGFDTSRVILHEQGRKVGTSVEVELRVILDQAAARSTLIPEQHAAAGRAAITNTAAAIFNNTEAGKNMIQAIEAMMHGEGHDQKTLTSKENNRAKIGLKRRLPGTRV